ncbi:MAG: hypothetical protein E6Q06_02025 [Candidatus Moraniibacteriota bacterium]|nr:MAG: hypothetical protein E6Q06_02025 [Candidatus Moranbacteria bacterium]
MLVKVEDAAKKHFQFERVDAAYGRIEANNFLVVRRLTRNHYPIWLQVKNIYSVLKLLRRVVVVVVYGVLKEAANIGRVESEAFVVGNNKLHQVQIQQLDDHERVRKLGVARKLLRDVFRRKQLL